MSDSKHTPGPWHYDGHGVNDASGERIATFAKRPKEDGGGYILSREQMDEVGEILASAPALLAALEDIIAVADSASETGHNEAEAVSGNWDVLGPRTRSAIAAAKKGA